MVSLANQAYTTAKLSRTGRVPEPNLPHKALPVAAPARELCAPRVLLGLSSRVLLLLRLHMRLREHVRGARPAAYARGWEHNVHIRVDPNCMLHHGGPSLVVQGRLVLRLLGAGPLWRPACAHALLTRECSAIWALTAVVCTFDYWSWPA
jgi:hypothetical protein